MKAGGTHCFVPVASSTQVPRGDSPVERDAEDVGHFDEHHEEASPAEDVVRDLVDLVAGEEEHQGSSPLTSSLLDPNEPSGEEYGSDSPSPSASEERDVESGLLDIDDDGSEIPPTPSSPPRSDAPFSQPLGDPDECLRLLREKHRRQLDTTARAGGRKSKKTLESAKQGGHSQNIYLLEWQEGLRRQQERRQRQDTTAREGGKKSKKTLESPKQAEPSQKKRKQWHSPAKDAPKSGKQGGPSQKKRKTTNAPKGKGRVGRKTDGDPRRGGSRKAGRRTSPQRPPPKKPAGRGKYFDDMAAGSGQDSEECSQSRELSGSFIVHGSDESFEL
jgi:hypothetical protein